MATLSRKTIAITAKMLERWVRTEIRRFFYENDVPDEMVVGSSKLDLVMNVFRTYESRGEFERILSLTEALLREVSGSTKAEIEQALLRDGFAVESGAVIDAEPEAAEQRSAVMALIEKHQADLDYETLAHHLAECEDLFRQEKWDSSISHCRNFVEQLLGDIARAVVATTNDTPDLSQPKFVRQYLETSGFFDEPEKKKLVDGVYGYFSEEGSHPGISTQSAARVSKSILLAFAFYVLEKHDGWRGGGFQLT